MILHNSHQPFLFTHNNQLHLAYCEKEKIITINKISVAIWNVFILNLETNIKKKIFNVQNRIECNPCVRYENGNVVLNFVASDALTSNATMIRYYLKSVVLDDSFNALTEEQQIVETFSGFETQQNILSFALECRYEYIAVENKTTSAKSMLDISSISNGFARIIPIFNTSEFIVTDPHTQRSFYIKDNFTSNPPQIKNNKHESVYKCSILNNIIAYAIKKQDFEDRDIIIEDSYFIE